jgi:hypothetical protein
MPLQDSAMDRGAPGPRRRRWSDGSTPGLEGDAPWSMADQWPAVVGALAAGQLDLLRTFTAFADQAQASGCMADAQTQALRRAVADLQHTSLRAQQLTRLASGRIRQYRESLDLSQVVRAVLRDRSPGAALSQSIAQADLSPVDLFMDAAVAYTIVDSSLAWMFARCRDIVIRTEPARGDDGNAMLVITGRRFAGDAPEGAPRRRRLEDGLDLVLARQAADSAGLPMQLRQDGPLVGISVLFPQALTGLGGGLPGLERPTRAPVPNTPEWVLVITTDSGLVSSAAFGLGQAGFETRGAQTARDARAKLRESPVGVILDEDAAGGEFDALRAELLAADGPRPLIEIVRRADAASAPPANAREDWAKVARNDVVPDIAPTLLVELAKAS